MVKQKNTQQQMRTKSSKKPLHKRTVERARYHVRLAVVPHARNQFYPHLIRRRGIAIVLMLVMVGQFMYIASQGGAVLGNTTTITEQQLLQETNKERTANGVAAVAINQQLEQAAKLKAQDMFAHQYWSHTSPSGVEPWQWFRTVGYTYSAAGENLAKNFRTTDSVVRAWMHSQEHRKNLLDAQYADVGFAVVNGVLNGEESTLVVAMYGAVDTTPTVGAMIPTVLAASDSPSFMARIGERLQALNPTVIATLLLLLFVSVVALIAYQYRHDLPKPWRTGWRRHRALYKAVGMMSLAAILIVLYGGGQI